MPFVEKADYFGIFGREKNVLEIGPGYGRLLSSILSKSLPFKSYLGVDISVKNVKYLTERFCTSSETPIHFVKGDAENVVLDSNYDSLISSLTFKHFYPRFEKGLANIAQFLRSGAMACFDLKERKWNKRSAVFESDGVTYMRRYSK